MSSSKKKIFTEVEKDALRYLQNLMGLGYREFAGEEVSYSIVSDLLNPSKDKDSILIGSYISLMANVRRLFRWHCLEGRIHRKELKKATDALLALELGVPLEERNLRNPGGNVDGYANYIDRTCDVDLTQNADEPLTLVFGPVFGGKSAALHRHASALRAKGKQAVIIDFANFETAYGRIVRVRGAAGWDCDWLVAGISAEILKAMGTEMALEDVYQAFDEVGGQNFFPAFRTHLGEMLNKQAELHLIFDSTEALSDLDNTGSLLDQFHALLFDLKKVQERSKMGSLHLVSVASERSSSYNQSSGIEYQSFQVHCNFLDEDQVRHLGMAYGFPDKVHNLDKHGNPTGQDSIPITEILETFGGHPYLSHVAVRLLSEGYTWQEVSSEKAWDTESQFKRYWVALSERLRRVVAKTDANLSLSEVFSKIKEGRSNDALFLQLRPMLINLGILNNDLTFRSKFVTHKLGREK